MTLPTGDFLATDHRTRFAVTDESVTVLVQGAWDVELDGYPWVEIARYVRADIAEQQRKRG